MKAIVNEPSIYRMYAGDVFEIVEEREEEYTLESVFSDYKINVKKDDTVKEKNGKITIFEAPYTRNPEDNYLSVKLIYLVNKEEYGTYICNKETGGLSGGNYFVPKKITPGEMQDAFNKAFNDFVNR